MSPESQRIAIAEACGWTRVANISGKRWCRNHLCLGPHHSLGSLPDYLADLNAMHEAEKTLSNSDLWFFNTHLSAIVNTAVPFAHATAAQRAEAFLRTIGEWDDAK